jgi:outer membrane protein OmpA-like peptidoglycan-associated protein
MSSALVEGLTDVFKSQALGQFAARSGESESTVLRGFETTIVAMISGLASKLKQSGSSRQLLDLINSPANDSHILENARSLVEAQPTDGLGSKLISMLFGNNLPAVTDSIGSVAGLRRGTAASLMSLGAPLLLGSLVQRLHQGGMDSSRLTKFVSEEAAQIQGSLPRGMPALLGSDFETVPPVASGVVPEKRRSIWPFLLAGLLCLLGLLLWLNSRTAAVVEPVRTATNSAIDFVTRTLPGSINLRIPVGRMEDHLLAFIQDPSKLADETTWFDFDRLLFDTNSATLQPSSREQLNNIAMILKAYPSVHVKIGGYTDSTGDAAANQTLSQQRADTVRQQLIDMGVSGDRLEAQGYGEQYPVGDNSTEEGRQKNRRISLRVTQK